MAVAFVMMQCTTDAAVSTTDLEGRWNIKEAMRDGQPTETMTGMYFVFDAEGNLTNNMLGEEIAFTYELDGKKILQRGGPLAVDYSIVQLEGNELILTTELRNSPFRIVLTRE